MTVLTYAGKPINWAKPPKSTTLCLWSQRTTSGKMVTGSLRSLAALDRLNNLAKKKFGRGLVVIQSAYNTGVKASAGTHDADACYDVWIPGVDPWTQQAFFRANGAGAYYRFPPTFPTKHIHLFILPPRKGDDVNKSWMLRGFKVGYLVDGGWSSRGKKVASSQIADYYGKRDALATHKHDTSWFPGDINATIFDLGAYIAKRAGVPVVAPKPMTAPVVHGLLGAPNVVTEKDATMNLMALPKNKNVMKTLTSAPRASTLFVQEADKFHGEIQRVPGYVTTNMPGGRAYSCFVLWNPEVWDHVETRYPLAYEGHHGVSLTRHIAVTVLRHRYMPALVKSNISYHSVTAGGDKIRRRLRKQGDAVVRREVRAERAKGRVVTIGTDQNRTRKVFTSARLYARHILDAIYGWPSPTVRIGKNGQHHVNTPSDHDTLVVTYIAQKK